MTRLEQELAVLKSKDESYPSRYAATPSDALQCWIDAVWTVDRIRQRGEFGTDKSNLLLDDLGSLDWNRQLLGASVYFWTRETASLVSQASASYPLRNEEAISLEVIKKARIEGRTLDVPSYLPRIPTAFCVFEALPPLWVIDAQGNARCLSALYWGIGVSAARNEIWLSTKGVDWVLAAGRGVAYPIWWHDGGSTGRVEDPTLDPAGTYEEERERFTRWICTASTFLEQEILAKHTAQAARPMRRRLGLKADDLPTIHVITLRKEIADTMRQDGTTDVEWSHRWIVRGHWRRHYFPSRGTHAPIWIHPYVKGPEDKPFREPKPTVFSVSR